VRPIWSLIALCFAAFAPAQEPVATSGSTVTFGTTTVIPAGLRGVVYHIRRNTVALPDFRKLKPAGTIYTSSLNVPPQDFKQGFPGVTKKYEWFAIDYTGRFWIDKPGAYTFVLTSDDGARLYIDDEVIVSNDGLHPPRDVSGSAILISGIHGIRVAYFQGPRLQVALVLKVAPPGEDLRIFSTDEFKPPLHPESWPVDPPGKPTAKVPR
jgi:PA14 domain-containing protein